MNFLYSIHAFSQTQHDLWVPDLIPIRRLTLNSQPTLGFIAGWLIVLS
jgi:hypothetical protein